MHPVANSALMSTLTIYNETAKDRTATHPHMLRLRK